MTGRSRGPVFEAKQKALDDSARVAAETAAAEAAALEKSHESQRKALKRKGRRASIFTSSQGVVDPSSQGVGRLTDKFGVDGPLG